jgi:hypothetical protein
MNTTSGMTTPTWQPPPAPRQSSRRPLLIVAAVVAVPVALLLIIGIGINAASGPAPAPAWRARVERTAVISPAGLAVTVKVTNTGHAAGTPQCTVQASDPSGAYSGFDTATLAKPVHPGVTVLYVDNIVITSQGAARVTKVTVSCQ